MKRIISSLPATPVTPSEEPQGRGSSSRKSPTERRKRVLLHAKDIDQVRRLIDTYNTANKKYEWVLKCREEEMSRGFKPIAEISLGGPMFPNGSVIMTIKPNTKQLLRQLDKERKQLARQLRKMGVDVA